MSSELVCAAYRFAVKALIDKACFCSIDDGCEEFINFCATMEHVLQHRLRREYAYAVLSHGKPFSLNVIFFSETVQL